MLMILTQMGYTFLYFITEASFNHGMNPHVYVTYRNVVSGIVMLPCAYYLERYEISVCLKSHRSSCEQAPLTQFRLSVSTNMMNSFTQKSKAKIDIRFGSRNLRALSARVTSELHTSAS